MRFKKNKIIISCFLTALFLGAVFFVDLNDVSAQEIGMNYAENLDLPSPAEKDIRVVLVEIVRYFITFLGIIAVAMVMYSGFLWMTSNGEPEKVAKAKRTLINSIIGLIIIISAFAIVTFIINLIGDGMSGGSGSSRRSGDVGGLGVFGACAIESVYPEPYQKDVPRNTSIVVTFIEEVDEVSIISGGNIIDDGRIKIYMAGDEANYLAEVKAANLDNKTFIFQPVNLLGSPSENIDYYVYLSNDIQKLNEAEGVFEDCGIDKFAEWTFEVSNKVDITPPQVKAGGIFPGPDNEQDIITEILAEKASGEITVLGAPVGKEFSAFTNLEGVKSASLSDFNIYSTAEGALLLAVQGDGVTVKLENSSTGVSLGAVDIIGDKIIFSNFFTLTLAASEIFEAGDSWTVDAGAYIAGDTLSVGIKTYAFGEDGDITIGTTDETAQNIANVLNSHPDVAATVGANVVSVKAREAGAAGNSIILSSSDNDKIRITKEMAGGRAAGEEVEKIGREDKPRNAVIQIEFNEAINPISVSGLAFDVKNKINVECLSGDDCVAANDGYFACDTDNDSVEDEVCLHGKFVLAPGYKTAEFISGNVCGVNGCGEKIYCLPARSNLRINVNAASFANCSSGEINCGAKPPYVNCIDDICKNDANENYPLSSLNSNGIIDMALNSLDGDRNDLAEGPRSQSGAAAYNENDLLGLCNGGDNNGRLCTDDNKVTVCGDDIDCKSGGVLASSVAHLQNIQGDDYAWSFYISNSIKSSAPVINEIVPGHSEEDVSLTKPMKITFDGLMMNTSLRTGQTNIFNGVETVTHRGINLRSLNNRVVGYWLSSANIDEPVDGEPDLTITEIRHSTFPDFTTYRAQVGSGVRDIYQNCFKPSAGPLCAPNSASPSCCPNGAAINAVDGDGLDGEGNCE
ncbi:Ig-like domain-containing protein [Candidatus Parcubacteria bacterium]|nr:Ig-like domain-containing protein [Candidatus Parcubacteria bacterium]